MQIRTATDAAANVPSILEMAIKGESTMITKNGKEKAVVVPIEVYLEMSRDQARARLTVEIADHHETGDGNAP